MPNFSPSCDWIIHRACPSCRLENSVIVQRHHLACQNPACNFTTEYACPICNESLHNASWKTHISEKIENNPIDLFICNHCNSHIPIQKITYMIDNGMIVDDKEKCSFCNGPTIHRSDMNISHRCFFFPKCSGQVDLFGTVKESLVFLDFETTGLEPGRDSIIEIGALKIDEDSYEHTFQTFIKPPHPISTHITQITGITDEMVSEAPEAIDPLKKLMSFIGNAKIVAHNADFDLPWLIVNLLQNKLPFENNDVICTLKWARQSGEAHCSLGALSKKYAIRHSNAHRALADAVATKELFFIFDGLKKSPRPQFSLSDYQETAQKLADKHPLAR